MKLQPIGFQTEKENNYYYSYSTKSFYLTHPLLYKIIEFGEKKTLKILHNLKNGIESSYFKGNTIEEIEYYLHKYNFLKQNNLINSKENCVVKNPQISAEDIAYEIDNCKNIVLEITQRCNLSCTYCAYGFYYENENTSKVDMQYSDAITILDFLLERKIKKYCGSKMPFEIGFYGGEPLLNIRLIKKIIDYVENKYSNYLFLKYKITTNGILLNKHIKYLVDKKFKLSISLDGDLNHNYLRVFPNGKSSFDLVSKNIKDIKKKYPKYFKSNVLFLTVYHSKSTLKNIYDFFDKNYNKTTGISILSETGLAQNKKELFYKNIYKSTKDDKSVNKELSIKTIYSEPKIYNLLLVLKSITNIFHSNIHKINENKFEKVRILCSCIPFKNELFLRANGILLPCTEVGSNAIIGKIRNGKVEFSNQNIANRINEFTKKLNKFCTRCYNFDNCDFCIYRIDDYLLKQGKISCDEFMNYDSALMFYKTLIDTIEEKKYCYKEIFKNLYSYDEI